MAHRARLLGSRKRLRSSGTAVHALCACMVGASRDLASRPKPGIRFGHRRTAYYPGPNAPRTSVESHDPCGIVDHLTGNWRNRDAARRYRCGKGKTNREGWRGIAWFIVGTLLLSLAAVNRFPLTGLMLVPAVCAFILWQRDRYKWPQLAIAGLIVTVGAVYPLMYNQVTNTHWSGDGAYPSRSSLNFLLLSATGAPQPAWADPLWQTVAEQAPECLEGLRGSFLEGETSPWARADEMATACPAGVAWLNDNFSSKYAQFMLANPRSTARYVATMIGGVADPVAYARVKSPLPQAVSTIFEADRSRNADFQPIAGWLMVTAVMVGTIAVTRVRWSKGLLLASAVALGGLVSVIASVLMIMTESVRTTSPATIALLTGCILVLGESVRLIQRRSQPDD